MNSAVSLYTNHLKLQTRSFIGEIQLPSFSIHNTDPQLSCPYCLARGNLWPAVGTSILFLNGVDVGQSGLVVADQWGTCSSDRFLVKMPYDKEGTLRMVMPGHDLYLDVDRFTVPSWMPPVSIEDNALLHESLVGSLAVLEATDDQMTIGDSLIGIIYSCWRKRLPLDGADVWPMLVAHGVNPHRKSDIVNLFDFGKKILIATHGRAPVRRRRMPAMSQGRYLTKTQRDLRLRLFGHV